MQEGVQTPHLKEDPLTYSSVEHPRNITRADSVGT